MLPLLIRHLFYPGRSLYFIIKEFFQVRESAFALVDWLSPPVYPFAPNRLVVRVTLGDRHLQVEYGDVLPIEHIEPTPVYVSPDENGTHFYLLRESGYDRVHVPMYEP